MREIGSREWWGELVTLIYIANLAGIVGGDRFYRGQVVWGGIKAVTLGGALIWLVVDWCRYAYRFGKTGQWEKSDREIKGGKKAKR